MRLAHNEPSVLEENLVSSHASRRDVLAFAALGATALGAPSVVRAQGSLEQLSLALVPLASSGAVLIAQDMGWFREAGVEVTFKRFNAAGPVPVAVVSGDADLGVTGLTAGFYNMAGQGQIKVIAGQSREQPGFALNGYVATNAAWDAGLRKFEDFAGKRIGITTFGSTVHYSVLLAAKKFNVPMTSITLVPLQSIPNMVAAFKGGQVNGIVSPVNTFRQMEAEGFGKLIAWVGDLTPWQLGGLFASQAAIEKRRPAIEKFMVAYRRGCAAYNAAFNQRSPDGKVVKGPGYDEFIKILATAVNQKPELIEIGLPYIDRRALFDDADIAEQIALWQSAKQVNPTVTAAAVIDRSFL
jgi:NitT/TauT family transport system substrate-binding protein